MRLWRVFLKTFKEQTRDMLALSLSLLFAPFFVFLYWLFFPSGSTTYGVLVLNNDLGVQLADGVALNGGSQVVEAMRAVTYADGNPLLKINLVTDRAEAETRLRNRDAAALVIVPPDFSQAVRAMQQEQETDTTSVTFVGDLTNP
jgi:hypothetical protein